MRRMVFTRIHRFYYSALFLSIVLFTVLHFWFDKTAFPDPPTVPTHLAVSRDSSILHQEVKVTAEDFPQYVETEDENTNGSKNASSLHEVAGGETGSDATETRRDSDTVSTTTILSKKSENPNRDDEEFSIYRTGNETEDSSKTVVAHETEKITRSVPTKAPVSTLVEKCEYSESDRRLVRNRNASIELSPKPSPKELDTWYGRQFRTLTFDELDLWEHTMPFLNATTVAKAPATPFHSGFRNQMMMFTAFYMKVAAAGYEQVILQTLSHGDLYNTQYRNGIRHQDLFDVKHWNSFYPAVPRVVHCDPKAFPEFSCKGKAEHVPAILEEQGCVTQPYRYWPSFPDPWVNFRAFQAYQKRKGPLVEITDEWPNPVHKTMLEALRLHPDLMGIANRHMTHGFRKDGTDLATADNISSHNDEVAPSYMALHTRIEPDMVYHNFGCPEMDAGRVRSINEILQLVEQHWPEPPVQHVFLPINRVILEDRIESNRNDTETDRKRTESAAINLQQLDGVLEKGMWGGRVKVFEFGPNALVGTKYERFKGVCGAAVDYELAKNADILVGTPISSFSVDLATDRFFRNQYANYFFNETGVHHWTKMGDKYPPYLHCCPSQPGKCSE